MALATLCLGLMGGVGATYAAAPGGGTDDEIMRAIEGGIESTAGAPIFAEIKRSFPKEWATYRREILDRYRRNDQAAAEAFTGEFITTFLQGRFEGAAKAPTPELMVVAGAQAALARSLEASDAAACVQLVWGSGTGLDTPEPSQGAFSNYVRAILAADAAAARRPTSHVALKPDDFTEIIRALRTAGADETTLEIIGAAGKSAKSPEASCAAGLALMEAVTVVSPELQASFVAGVLSGG